VLTSRRTIRRLLDARPPDILEVSDKVSLPWLARWSRRRQVPVVLFSHERLDAILRPRVPRWFPLRATADAVNRRLSRLADQVVVTSAFSGTEFERVGAANVRHIRLGVDLETFQPVPRAAGDGSVRLVTVSRLSREKRPQLAIDALRVLCERGVPAHLVLIGDGPMRARLRRRAAGLPVTFLGHLSDRRALAGIVAGADVALFPSPAETFGLATLEALACGTPVVVPASGAAAELLDGPGSGAVSDGTGAGMAAATAGLLAMPEPERRAAARAAAQRYPWTGTVAALLDGYQEIGLR
jgi:alpha-1,6-mannosyltransferase